MALIRLSRRLCARADKLRFGAPITHVYNPLNYARAPHEAYLKRYGEGPKEALLVGMNPGPFGMVQTGVPFGDVAMVRDWLGISGPVTKPSEEHPKRPVRGFACARSEVSGSRLWGWARDRFGTPKKFFARFFVWNYCPLCFMSETGANVTPDKLRAAESKELYAACDDALRAIVDALDPEFVIGVGRFAEDRIRTAVGPGSRTIGRILHPSPASPAANKNWAGTIEKELRKIGLSLKDE